MTIQYPFQLSQDETFKCKLMFLMCLFFLTNITIVFVTDGTHSTIVVEQPHVSDPDLAIK
jgi:hypothetical protein